MASLRIRQSDARAFTFGVNMAATPGKVIFRNALMELIQYEPTTPEVYKRPLLIVPPWINKYYVLDLNPEKSFVRWAVGQGLTVFVVSWVNPDERHADKDFDSYMREGMLAALDIVEQATGEREVAAIGYCVGGTLLAATLAYMAAVGDRRITSATFFATQIDFTDAGDLKVFVDAEQLKAVEERMAEHGYLEGSQMANAFNMLRPNELIWSYYVNNYLKGKEPMPFDLLVWNSELDPHARRQPQVLSSALLPAERSLERAHGAQRQDARPQEGDDPGLRAGDQRGPHRAGPFGVHRGAMFRRPRALRDGGVGPYRRRRQPAGEAEISVLDGRAARRRVRRMGGESQGDARLVVAGLGRVGHRPGSGQGRPPASPAAAS